MKGLMPCKPKKRVVFFDKKPFRREHKNGSDDRQPSACARINDTWAPKERASTYISAIPR